MTLERRGHDRESLAKADIPGQFLIECEGNSQGFSLVSDVSISGMGLTVSQAIDVGKEVQIKYVSDEFNVCINAVVVWCLIDEKETRIGVSFSAEDLDANVMLFMTLREFIDDFGEAF